jgi:hypothetical protein
VARLGMVVAKAEAATRRAIEELPPASGDATAAASPPAPPYDLSQDLAQREVEAKQQFGARAKVVVVGDVFLLAGRRPVVNRTARLVERALDAYYNGRFTVRPPRAISVYLFATARPFHSYCKQRWQRSCSTPYGFYLREERRIVMNVGPGVGTLTHELVHPIVAADFPDAPDWIDEGIASLYECFHFPRRGHIRGTKNWRHPRLLRALTSRRERELGRLPRLFGMSDATFRGEHEDLHYAMARYVCQWLDARGMLWPFYRKWREEYHQDPTGRQAFIEVVGVSPEEAHGRWARWVRRL